MTRKGLRALALLGLIPALLVLGWTGCSKGSAAKGKFTFVLSQYSDATEPFAKKVVEDFQKQNPGITVDLQVVGWDVINQKVNTMVATGQAPGLLNLDQYASFAADSLLMPTEEVISPQLKAKFYDSFYNACKINGTAYAMPLLASIRSLYYNKDIFDKAGVSTPPKTWQELVTDAKAIRDKTGIDPFGIDMTSFEGEAFVAYFLWGNGGAFKQDGKWVINSPKNIEAVQFVADLVNKDKATNPQPTAIGRDDLQKVFGQGKLAMMITANFFPTILKSEAPNVKYGVGPIPVNQGVSPFSLGVEDFLMVFKSTKAPKAIGKFLDYFYDDSRYIQFMTQEGMLPATKSAGKAMSASDPLTAQFIDTLPIAKFYPVTDPKWAQVKPAIIKAFQQVILGQKSAKDALDEVQKVAEAG